MREIEFRGQLLSEAYVYVDTNTYTLLPKRTFVYGSLVKCESGESYIVPIKNNTSDVPGGYCGECYRPFDDCFQVIPETVGQHTGLKRIFEDDIILDAKNTKGLIVFKKYGFYIKIIKSNSVFVEKGNPCFPLWNFDEREIEIIGNSHDNPELLEEIHNG